MSDSKEKRGEAEICANDCCWFLAQLWSGVSLKPNGYPSKAMMTMAVQTNMDDEACTHCSESDQFVQKSYLKIILLSSHYIAFQSTRSSIPTSGS